MNINDSKAQLRQDYLGKRHAMSPQEVQEKSDRICKHLIQSSIYKEATHVAAYISFQNEVDLSLIIEDGIQNDKRIYIPTFKEDRYQLCHITRPESLSPGKYGILEPNDTTRSIPLESAKPHIQLWLVPLVAFNEHGHRLGRGGGYYDQFLQGATGLSCGIAYGWQYAKDIPNDAHDISLNNIMTEDGLYTHI